MRSNKQKNIIYKEIKPESKLSTFVKSFWYFENNELEIQNYSILPDGCFDLFILKETAEKKYFLQDYGIKILKFLFLQKLKFLQSDLNQFRQNTLSKRK